MIYVRTAVGNLDMKPDLSYLIAMLQAGGPILAFVQDENVAYLDFQLPLKVIENSQGPGSAFRELGRSTASMREACNGNCYQVVLRVNT